jgi:hypothetical protein
MVVDEEVGAAMVATGVVFVVILQLYAVMAGGVAPLKLMFRTPAAQMESAEEIRALGRGNIVIILLVVSKHPVALNTLCKMVYVRLPPVVLLGKVILGVTLETLESMVAGKDVLLGVIE